MANNFIDVKTQAAVIATAFDSLSVKPLRPNYVYDAIAQEKVWALSTMPKKGDSITFVKLGALSANTGALDTTASSITGSQKVAYTRVNVPMTVYGDHSVIDTLELGNESFIDVVSDVAFSLQDQAMNSMNRLARATIEKNKFANGVSGTLSTFYHYYASNATAKSMGPLRAIDVRKIVADMKADNVQPLADGFYVGIVHPIVATQLRAETGNASWGAAVLAGDGSVQLRFAGDIGTFEGVRFVTTSEVGSTSTIYSSYFLGKDALGKAVGKDVGVSVKPDLDGPHSNLLTVRWNALLGYGIVRRESVRIVSSKKTVK
jgi:N4-gp56 family major capsid protein